MSKIDLLGELRRADAMKDSELCTALRYALELVRALKGMRALRVERWRDDIITVTEAEMAADKALAKCKGEKR